MSTWADNDDLLYGEIAVKSYRSGRVEAIVGGTCVISVMSDDRPRILGSACLPTDIHLARRYVRAMQFALDEASALLTE